MRVAELWRYPVKSMGGERLDRARLTLDGIAGDRVVHVADARGATVTARTAPRLLRHKSALGADGEPRVDGHLWTAPAVVQAVRDAAGDDARLVRQNGPERFDVLPVLVATDGAIAALGIDGRRLRPNIVVSGVAGLGERQWPGRRLQIGQALIELVKLRGRCVMTTYDPDTQAQDLSVLRRIAQELGGRMALDASVLQGGTIAVGDVVTLL